MGAARRSQLPNLQASGSFQVIALGQDEENQNRDYKRRRPHKKTRTGCLACKQRRVKCDQATPSCLRCRRNHRDCVYTGNDGGSFPKLEEDDSEAPQLSNINEAPGQVGPSSGTGHAAERVVSLNRTVVTQTAVSGRRPPAAFRMRHHNQNALLSPSDLAAANRPNFRSFVSQPFSDLEREIGTPSIELLHHFETAGTTVFAMPVYTGSLVPLAAKFPHLRGTILAVAAAHMCNRVPSCKEYRLAEHFQQNLALRDYQRALVTPLVVQGQAGVDALLMTAMLMNMLAFVLPTEDTDDMLGWNGSSSSGSGSTSSFANSYSRLNTDGDPDPRRSWVFSPHPNRLGFMALLMGLTPLLIATEPWREKSFLRPLFANSDDERRTLTGTWQSLNRVPQSWLDLFGLDRKSTPRRPPQRSSAASSSHSTPAVSPCGTPGPSGSSDEPAFGYSSAGSSSGGSSVGGSSHGSGNSGSTTVISEADRLYRGPLRVLAEIRQIPAVNRNVLAYFQFMGHLLPEFRFKLFDRDEKTLWLFGMWLGMMCRFEDVWWVRRRVRCDFRAIRLWLHLVGVAGRPGAEGKLWRELLKELDATWGYEFDADMVTI